MAETSTSSTNAGATAAYTPPPLRAPASPSTASGDRTSRRSVGLTWRIFTGIAIVVVVVLGVTLAVASAVAQRNATDAVRDGLAQTAARISSMLVEQRNAVEREAELVVDNPSFRSDLGAAIAKSDSATVLDQAVVAATTLRVNFTQITNTEGIRVAKSDDSAAAQVDLSGSSLIGAALNGDTASGFGVVNGNTLFQAVAVPIMSAGRALVGTLMAARVVTDTMARAIAAQTGTQILFYAVDANGHHRIVIAPPAFGDPDALTHRVESMLAPDSSAKVDSSGMMMMSSDKLETVSLAGTKYVGERVGLLSKGHTEAGGFIALRDIDRELAGYYRLRNWLLLSGAGSLVIAFLLSVVIARQIARPVQVLVAATQRAADGDYAAEIPATTGDEIGTLAAAFSRLLADLRDKQALVEFLQGASGGRTVPMERVTPTMQAAMGGGAVLTPGQTLANRYEVKSVLGVGGMGMVYKAVDRELGDVVAVKTLKPDMMQQDPSALERFKSEIRLARRISHRNVVRTHDIGESGGIYYITMEFVEGKSLKELIVARGRLPVSVALPIAKQLCRALEVAHDEGVIHRDIKPQNMVVEPSGVLKVMDFGIARLAQRSGGQTQAGMVVGTPEYMAPEQLMGTEIDGRADLYAAGAVLYECLTGRLPHEADTPITLITRVLDETPRPPQELQPDIPRALSDLISRTLSKNRDQRPRSAGELYQALDRL